MLLYAWIGNEGGLAGFATTVAALFGRTLKKTELTRDIEGALMDLLEGKARVAAEGAVKVTLPEAPLGIGRSQVIALPLVCTSWAANRPVSAHEEGRGWKRWRPSVVSFPAPLVRGEFVPGPGPKKRSDLRRDRKTQPKRKLSTPGDGLQGPALE